MRNGAKFSIVVLLGAAVAGTFILRAGKRAGYVAVPVPTPAVAPAPQPEAPRSVPAAATADPAARSQAVQAAAPRVAASPRLLELGSMRCQACLEMAKVLDALRASQGEKLQVDFIDVFEQPAAAERYKVAMIPTQVLFDPDGREIFRHVGYFSHDEILAKFNELGVKL